MQQNVPVSVAVLFSDVSSQSGTMTEIKKERFDMMLDGKKHLA